MSKAVSNHSIFICVDYLSKITKTILASSTEEASNLFLSEYKVLPSEVLGPFLKKKTKIIETKKELKFTNQSRKAVYNDWVVNAFLLLEPTDHAYLVFLKRNDDKKIPSPKGVIIVPINDLRFI